MSNSKIKVVGRKKVAYAELTTNLFVRSSLNQDHALYLAELIESGVKLPPIRITANNEVVDGRHRLEAYSLNNIEEGMAEIVEVEDETHLIAAAYKANLGGSLPPTTADTEHTIELLIKKAETIKNIADLLALPPALARKYVQTVKSRLARTQLMVAAAAVTEGGLTVAKAAETHSVDVDKLKVFLGGGRKKKNKQDVADLQRRVTQQYKSVGSRNAALMRGLMEKLEDGDMSAEDVRAIIKHIQGLVRKNARAIQDWEKRFEAKIRPSDAAA